MIPNTLRNKIAAAVASGATAAGVAAVLLGSGNDGLEGIRHYAYGDVIGVQTVCYGHTGPDIVPKRYYTTKQCEALLQADLVKVASQIDPLITVPLTTTQRAAMYSFAYNVGAGNFARSQVLKNLNARNYEGACAALRNWTLAGGKKWQGLVTRREVEKQVCEWQQQPIKSLVSPSSASPSAG